MAAVVAKFGGTSLADAKQFKKVKDIIMSDPDRKYVVPSAPGKRFSDDTKVTDLLYSLYAKRNDGKTEFEDVYKKIFTRFCELRDDLDLSIKIEDHIEKIKNDILDGESEDYAASRGEYLSGVILAEYLGYEFVDPKDYIFFDENGVFQEEETKTVFRGKLKNVKNAVIPGFYGSTPSGSIKTFSRGGSDITGAIVARTVRARLYENWTDVSGFMMADPRIVKDPKIIKTITYRELRELAYMGATVIHEDCIFPVFTAGISINVKNTNAPEEEGTMIIPDMSKSKEADIITGIAGKKNFTVIAIEKNKMNYELGFGRRILRVIEKNEINFEHMPTGIDTLSLVVETDKINGKKQKIIDDIFKECEPDSIEIFDNLALIATVGRGMIRNVGIAAKLFAALSDANINVRMIDQGSSELNIIVGVENDDFAKAVNAIYKAFV
ncbi:MAG: aspartate kinase [Eubacteriales bacterium]